MKIHDYMCYIAYPVFVFFHRWYWSGKRTNNQTVMGTSGTHRYNGLSLKVPPTHRPYPLPTHRLLTNDLRAAPPAAPTQRLSTPVKFEWHRLTPLHAFDAVCHHTASKACDGNSRCHSTFSVNSAGWAELVLTTRGTKGFI